MQPLVSIVIPTFNRKNELKFAIKSVISQTYKNWELVIVDNNSTDGTAEMIESFNLDKLKHIKINNHGIIAKSRNKGIANASGEYIAFLDSDDWWSPKKIECCIAECIKGFDFVYHNLMITKTRNYKYKWKKIYAWQLMSPVYESLILTGNPIATSSVVVKKDLIDSVEGFSENSNLIAAEDYDCWIKISKKTDKFKAIHQPLGYWFYGDNTSSSHLSLIFLDTLLEKYIKPLQKKLNRKLPVWWLYAKGRALYLEKDYPHARLILISILHKKASFIVKLKSLYMISLSMFKTNKNGY